MTFSCLNQSCLCNAASFKIQKTQSDDQKMWWRIPVIPGISASTREIWMGRVRPLSYSRRVVYSAAEPQFQWSESLGTPGAGEGQKRVSDPLELELQMVKSRSWDLNPDPSGRASRHPLNQASISPAPFPLLTKLKVSEWNLHVLCKKLLCRLRLNFKMFELYLNKATTIIIIIITIVP